MPTREEIIEKLSKPTYSKNEVAQFVRGVKKDRPQQPIKLKKGDVITVTYFGKVRPMVVAKTNKEHIIMIPLSSTKDSLNIHIHDSRFFGQGFFNKQLLTFKREHVEGNFIGVLDDNSNLNIAIKKLKEYYSNLI